MFGRFVTLFRGLFIPVTRLFIILFNAFTHEIHIAKVVLGFSVALFRRASVPVGGFNVIRCYAQPLVKEGA